MLIHSEAIYAVDSNIYSIAVWTRVRGTAPTVRSELCFRTYQAAVTQCDGVRTFAGGGSRYSYPVGVSSMTLGSEFRQPL